MVQFSKKIVTKLHMATPIDVVVFNVLASESPWAIMWRCLRYPTFRRFGTIPACDRQTHRQTDTHRHTTTA